MAGRGLKIPFVEVGIRDGRSPQEEFQFNDSRARRIFRVDWARRADAVWQILGYPYVEGGKLRRYLPEVHPDFPWLTAVRIVECKGVGHHPDGAGGKIVKVTRPDGDVAAYKYAELTVEYEFLDYLVRSDDEISTVPGSEFERFVTPIVEPGAEFLPIIGHPLKWAEGNLKDGVIPDNWSKLIPHIHFTWIWRQVPDAALPVTNIETMTGRINKDTFYGYTPGQLLFEGPKYHRVRSPFGTIVWDVEYKVKFAKHGHDKLFAGYASPPGFYQVSTDGDPHNVATAPDGKLLFDVGRFASLFDKNINPLS